MLALWVRTPAIHRGLVLSPLLPCPVPPLSHQGLEPPSYPCVDSGEHLDSRCPVSWQGSSQAHERSEVSSGGTALIWNMWAPFRDFPSLLSQHIGCFREQPVDKWLSIYGTPPPGHLLSPEPCLGSALAWVVPSSQSWSYEQRLWYRDVTGWVLEAPAQRVLVLQSLNRGGL